MHFAAELLIPDYGTHPAGGVTKYMVYTHVGKGLQSLLPSA